MITTAAPVAAQLRPVSRRLQQAAAIITGGVAVSVTLLSVAPTWWGLLLAPVVALLWARASALTETRTGARLVDVAVAVVGLWVLGLGLTPGRALVFAALAVAGRLVLGRRRGQRLIRLGRRDRPADHRRP